MNKLSIFVSIFAFIFATSLPAQVQIGKGVQIGGASGGVGCGAGNCIVSDPASDQEVVEPAGKTIAANSLQSEDHVGTAAFATVADAITDACLTTPYKTVVIDPSYAGTEYLSAAQGNSSVTNPCGARIIDKRTTTQFQAENTLGMLFSSQAAIAGRYMKGTLTVVPEAVRQGHLKIAIVGTSIFESVSGLTNLDGFPQSFEDAVKGRFPGVDVEVQNFSVGSATSFNFVNTNFKCGTDFTRYPANQNYGIEPFVAGDEWVTWKNGCTTGDAWIDDVIAWQPDLIIMGFETNDVGADTTQVATQLATLINSFRPGGYSSKAADVVLVTDPPAYGYAASPFGNKDLPRLTQYWDDVYRSVADQYGVPLADADALASVVINGIDPTFRMGNWQTNLSNYATAGEWQTLQGSDPAYSSGSTLSSTLTFSGTGALVSAVHPSLDGLEQVTFNSIAASAVPSIYYRESGLGTYYILQGAISGSTWSGQLYSCVSTNCSAISGGVASCPVVSGALDVTVKFAGAHHEAYCAGVKKYDLYDYRIMTEGNEGFGYQVAGGVATRVVQIFRNRQSNGTPTTAPRAFYGTYCTTYSGNGDFDSNPYSLGGDCLHHFNAITHHLSYYASLVPLIDLIEKQSFNRNVYSAGTSKGGLGDGGSGFTDLITGTAGLRIVTNDRASVAASWAGDSLSQPMNFFVQPQHNGHNLCADNGDGCGVVQPQVTGTCTLDTAHYLNVYSTDGVTHKVAICQ